MNENKRFEEENTEEFDEDSWNRMEHEEDAAYDAAYYELFLEEM